MRAACSSAIESPTSIWRKTWTVAFISPRIYRRAKSAATPDRRAGCLITWRDLRSACGPSIRAERHRADAVAGRRLVVGVRPNTMLRMAFTPELSAVGLSLHMRAVGAQGLDAFPSGHGFRADDEDGAGCRARDPVGYRAEDEPVHARMVLRADHDEIGADVERNLGHRRRRASDPQVTRHAGNAVRRFRRQLVELTARLGEAASEQVLRLREKLLWVGCQGGNGERMDQVKLGTRLGAGQIFRRFERFERGAREIDAHQDHRAGPSAAIVGSRHVASLSYAESAFAVPARYQRPT